MAKAKQKDLIPEKEEALKKPAPPPAEDEGHAGAILTWVIVVLVLLAGLLYYFRDDVIGYLLRDAGEASTVSQTWDRDLGEAYTSAQKVLLEEEAGSSRWVWANLIASDALFYGGLENGKRDAVELVTERYRVAKNNSERADAINHLITFYYTDRNRGVYEYIFSKDEFSEFRKEVPADSVRALAEHSLSLKPTSHAHFFVANWYAGELLDNEELEDDTAREYAITLADEVAKAEEVFLTEERPRLAQQVLGISGVPFFFHWKGFLLGAAAGAQSRYLTDALNSFDQVFDFYTRYSQAALIETILPYSHFYKAAYLNAYAGEDKSDEVRAHLGALVERVLSKQSIHETGFISFVKIESVRAESEQDHNHRWFRELAEVSPRFKDFLERHGWDFE